MTRHLVFRCALCVMAGSCALADAHEASNPNASHLLSNGSFETGASAPEGWHLYRGASWASGAAHSGTRSSRGVSKSQELICQSDSVGLMPGHTYRLEGWVNCASGLARLGVDFL